MRCRWQLRSNGLVYTGMVAFFAFVAAQSSRAAQEANANKAGVETGKELAIGSRVVLKSSDVMLDDDGKLVPTKDQFAFGIERIEGDRLFLASYDRKTKGLVNRTHVLPYDLALDYFNDAIARNPNNTDAYWRRGRLWYSRGQYDRLLADLEQAIRLGPDQAKFHNFRGRAFDSTREFDKALTEWNQAIGLDPKNATANVGRAHIWREKRDYKRAIADFDEALRLDPTDAHAWSFRSKCWQDEGNFEKALRDINEAIRLAPTRNFFYTNRSGVWEMKPEYDKSLVDLNESIRLNPKDHFAYGFRAHVWGQKHERDKEIADYSEAIKLDPSSVYYFVSRGNSWSAQGRHAEAIADFNEAIRLAPKSASAYIDRDVEWQKDAIAGRVAPDRAIADFTRAIELDPKSGDAYHFRALALDQKHEYSKAMRDWSEYARIEESDPFAQRLYARRLATSKDASLRNGRRAVEIATRACELSKWKDIDCLDTLAAAYAETGDFPAAIKWETKAIELIRYDLSHATDTKEFRMRDRLKLYQKQQPYRQ